MPEARKCTPAIHAGRRLAKARQFHLAADTIATIHDDQSITDAYVTLCVLAGIAAADVLCCARLGEHHQGDNHQGAIALLRRADVDAAKHLKTLLDMKTRSSYSAVLTTRADRTRAGRAASALLLAAEQV